MNRAVLCVLAAVTALGVVAVPRPAASVASEELEAARGRRAALQQRLDAAAEELAAAEADAGRLSDERDALAAQLATLESEIATAEDRMGDRIRAFYKRGTDPMLSMLSADDPHEALEKATVVVGLVRDDKAEVEVASARRTSAVAVAARLLDKQEELDAAVARRRAAAEQLQADLAEAAALERRLEAEERARQEALARRRAAARAQARATTSSSSTSRSASSTATAAASASPAPVSGNYACPIGTPRSYSDTWGAPRSGGRSHRGTDMLAPYGTPIYAVTSGVVDLRGYGSSAGYWLILRGSNGDHYWYLHLQSFTVGDGARVSAGTQIGTNGDTGNARGTPHLHFERHIGGSSPVNPYPFLKGICG